MNFAYRTVVTGLKLSKKELEILKNAEKILLKADKELCDLEATYDGTEINEDFRELVKESVLNLSTLNINVAYHSE